MKNSRRKWKKALIIIAVIIAIIWGGGYIGLQYLKKELEAKITGCKLETKNFKTVVDFEYVNNWIVVEVKVDGSEKKFPFLFDTGAQTVIMDSLLTEIGPDNYKSYSLGNKSKDEGHAFNNELISFNKIELGDVIFKDIGAITAKNSKWGMLNCISAYGIIGYNVIQSCSFQIDYEKKQITITDNVESLANYEEIQWIKYIPSTKQESPIIQAIVNDSIKLDLMFDTGMSGGVKLYSAELYQSFLQQFPDHTRKFLTRPSLLIRGEKDELIESLIFRAFKMSVGTDITENMSISVGNKIEGEYDGLIGNMYLENYIVTLDYKNRRIGFIPQEKREEKKKTYGMTYLPFGEKMIVSAVYNDFEPASAGILPGDEIYSINGIMISELPANTFCEIYRREYEFLNSEDSLLQIAIIKNDTIIEHKFKKQDLFYSIP